MATAEEIEFLKKLKFTRNRPTLLYYCSVVTAPEPMRQLVMSRSPRDAIGVEEK
jgi:hypothetical protein